MKPIISPRELAAAIGVSESSLKRWADDGLVRVTKTAGGHRRITIGEAIRFIRTMRAPLLRPDLLGLSDLTADGAELLSDESATTRFARALIDGNVRAARGLILSLYLSGSTIAELADGPIRGAMEELGALWQHDAAGIYIEHRATDICLQAVQQLRQLVEPMTATALAIGGGPVGDPYLLPPMLVATALAADGWQSINLGPNTPIEALQAAITRHVPRVVWLSVSWIRDLAEVSVSVERLSQLAAAHGALFILGGQASTQLALPDLSPVRRGATIGEVVLFAREQNASPLSAAASTV